MYSIHKSNTALGMTILIGMATTSIVYNTVRHPVRMYRLLVHKKSWY